MSIRSPNQSSKLPLWSGSTLDYKLASGPDLLPDGPSSERSGPSEVILRQRLRKALVKINSDLPPKATDEALRKLDTNDAVLLIDRNHRFHDCDRRSGDPTHARLHDRTTGLIVRGDLKRAMNEFNRDEQADSPAETTSS